MQPETSDRRNSRRPSSPLRNSYTFDSVSGEFSEDGSINQEDGVSLDKPWSQRSHSPSPSITKFATNIAQRVGAMVGSTASRSSTGLPTEAELEAEAEMEREKSRREAEMIIRREAEERKMVEDGVSALMRGSLGEQPLLPPPPRAQSMSSNPSTPSSSPKEKESWFAAVKNKLAPTKEPLTPAQQIIQETKAKEKEKKKNKDKQWPAVSSGKFSDPAFIALSTSAASSEPITPPRPIARNMTMTPSPRQSIDSSANENLPLYAQLDTQGALDVSGTLLGIARRFEKLERWTVSHVRALEERMGDVERWLVEKEKEKELSSYVSDDNTEKSSFRADEKNTDDDKENELVEIHEELAELQGRVGELGREMAKLMTAPLHLNSGPARNAVVQSPVIPPTPASLGPRSLPIVPATASTPRNVTPVSSSIVRPKEVSPPSTSVISSSSRTRLPYPTGDYTSPPGEIPTRQEILSPTNSPPSSLNEAMRKRPVSIAGLPTSSHSLLPGLQMMSGLPREEATPTRTVKASAVPALSTAEVSGQRHSSISPTPRKRYTVALGTPITGSSATRREEFAHDRIFSASPVSEADVNGDDNDSSDTYGDDEGDTEAIGHTQDGIVGKSASRASDKSTSSVSMPSDTVRQVASSPRNSPGTPRVRAQSSYGPITGSSILSPSSSPSPIAPLRPRLRSKSTDRIGLGISLPNGSGQFVDPLILRRQEKDVLLPRTPKTPKFERGQKIPVGELVAFFDSNRK